VSYGHEHSSIGRHQKDLLHSPSEEQKR
jgi:hypothetical protein